LEAEIYRFRKSQLATNKITVLALWECLIEPGGPCRGQAYGPLIKSPTDLQSENTQATQDNQFSPLSEDEE